MTRTRWFNALMVVLFLACGGIVLADQMGLLGGPQVIQSPLPIPSTTDLSPNPPTNTTEITPTTPSTTPADEGYGELK